MAIWGLLANLIGTLILGFAMGSYYKWVNYSLDVYETFMASAVTAGKIVAIGGTNVHRNNKYRAANKWMIVGAVLIIAGFGLQLYAALIIPK